MHKSVNSIRLFPTHNIIKLQNSQKQNDKNNKITLIILQNAADIQEKKNYMFTVDFLVSGSRYSYNDHDFSHFFDLRTQYHTVSI